MPDPARAGEGRFTRGGALVARREPTLAQAVANSLRSRYVWKMSKSRRAWWRDLEPDKMAAHLLATPTITDLAWAEERAHAPRLPGEIREAFIRRVLLGETAS
jgi:hypothetical protein